MRFSAFAIVAVAKDCAVYYTWGDDPELNPARDQKSVAMCNDIGGTINPVEIALHNGGGKVNRCAICHGARGTTDDYGRTIMQNGEPLSFSVRCGYFGWRKCHE
ncbi:hypothetical protein H9Q72_006284 [Fusarium xylarioides]|uniref:Uncharacterized protein n=1 Tax=Fusarium xylarioides TaxID=221167 RepID=A0A9P7I1C4_9HYPO|nr:hypothetical protein H9Q70_012658 [Fusarium xylarioides]KAG5765639.1 hypothetical protein H9Q72_006284 [Fusarium xylarioides]KAG5773347.1 hypothetical protein H9Q73_012156 [Fusarium xylarioides]